MLELLKNRIRATLGLHPITEQEIQTVAASLEIEFSKEFLELNKICSYEYSTFINFFNFGSTDDYGVIGSTLGLRKGFQNVGKYVNLYSDDAGIILMNCSDQKCPVIWCSIYDLENLFNGKKLELKNDYFQTFTDFFVFLLDEEEKKRKN